MARRSAPWKAGWVGILGLCVALACPSGAIGVRRTHHEDQSSIRQIWHVAGEGRGVPAADRFVAYFLSKRHEVLALDATNGRELWRGGTGQPADATWGSVLLLTDRLVVAGDFDVVAFDRANGLPRWQFSPTDGYGPGIYLGSSAGGLVFAGSPAGRMYGIDQDSGLPRWSTLVVDEAGPTTVFHPVTDRELVVAGYTTFTAPTTGGVVALEAATGRRRWRTPFPRASGTRIGTDWAGGPVFTDRFIAAASGDGRIYAFDHLNGTIRWSIPPVGSCIGAIGPLERDFRPLTYTHQTLFAGSLTGCVAAHDIDTRRERWKYSSEEYGSNASSMAADDKALYVPYARGLVAAIGIGDGARLWSTAAQQRGFRWPPAIVGDRLYFASSTEGFYAFQR
ncbi:MAG: hypothetical protein C5B57_08810 [Blastocatellia bacterium]|nr:MAG: hypothetical protein C5B57_08810 [Blastocatellia bacterium]